MLKVIGVTVIAVATIIDCEWLSLAAIACFAIAGSLKVLEWASIAG